MEDKMLDFINQLIDEDIIGFDEEKFELEQKYAIMFGHGVPREMFPSGISENEIMKVVESCVQNQKDELLKIENLNLMSGLRLNGASVCQHKITGGFL
ncbi:MAG: hypothetical protein HFH68_09310 [Lachnospiraceae bacterium]|nr:hypothetical protein [Lachnospiraceae bacterium]